MGAVSPETRPIESINPVMMFGNAIGKTAGLKSHYQWMFEGLHSVKSVFESVMTNL